MEYKVMTQKDRFFSGKFDPEKLEMAINSYAEQGWKLIAVATATMGGGFTSGREELMVFMERQ
jgi:hypothetical protein